MLPHKILKIRYPDWLKLTFLHEKCDNIQLSSRHICTKVVQKRITPQACFTNSRLKNKKFTASRTEIDSATYHTTKLSITTSCTKYIKFTFSCKKLPLKRITQKCGGRASSFLTKLRKNHGTSKHGRYGTDNFGQQRLQEHFPATVW